MSNYRRYLIPGGTWFLTIVTFERRPIFAEKQNVQHVRDAIAAVKREMPFHIDGAVILPDHMHFIWMLPTGDSDFSKRVGKIKVRVTRALDGSRWNQAPLSPSGRKHKEACVWQRRFWEHTVRDEHEFEQFLNDIHFNPVKHGYASCPHKWQASSFQRWVQKGILSPQWGCVCPGAAGAAAAGIEHLGDIAGE